MKDLTEAAVRDVVQVCVEAGRWGRRDISDTDRERAIRAAILDPGRGGYADELTTWAMRHADGCCSHRWLLDVLREPRCKELSGAYYDWQEEVGT